VLQQVVRSIEDESVGLPGTNATAPVGAPLEEFSEPDMDEYSEEEPW